jgi:hypothetical protein
MRRDVPNYAKVRYTEIYSEIDLIYYSREGHLEYDLILRRTRSRMRRDGLQRRRSESCR